MHRMDPTAPPSDADRALAAQCRDASSEHLERIIAHCARERRRDAAGRAIVTDAAFPNGERVGG